MEVYLVRHGEVDENFNDLIPKPEAHLNEKGIEQARLAGKMLRNIHFDKIYSSPYPRAKETAEEINKSIGHEKIIFDQRLVDISLPSWHGLNKKEYNRKRAECRDGWAHYRRRDDESFVMAYQRVRGFYNDIIRLNRDKDIKILVVAHSDVIKSLFLLLLDLDVDTAKKIKIGNCGILHFKYTDIPYYQGFILVHSLFTNNILLDNDTGRDYKINKKEKSDALDNNIYGNDSISSGMGMFG